MAALEDLLASRSSLTETQIAHVQRLVAQWQLLADLSFADLLLWLPEDEAGTSFVCLAQCRPTTGQTAYLHDEVGTVSTGSRAQPIRVAYAEGRIFREGEADWDGDLPIRREAIPIRVEGSVVGVLGRDSNLASVRSPSQLELVYLQSAADLAIMVADGSFPGPQSASAAGSGPRVGDGLIRVEADSTVLYASPNALSALRRLGITGNVLGEPIAELTGTVADDPFDAKDLVQAVQAAVAGGQPIHVELEGSGASVRFQALPLRPAGEALGALILLQDNTELRRRDRALLSKDATIREIHHRVKNNLQTVAALLRLQARRVAAPEARLALEESMRRIASIALVHETLSVSVDEEVRFDEVLDRLLVMLADVTGVGDRVRLLREGSFGEIPAEAATSLVLVLTELIQNATEHAFGSADGHELVSAGQVQVQVLRRGSSLQISITDDGHGLPAEFSVDGSDRLGLQIVQTLVTAELGGTFSIAAREDGITGTRVIVNLKLR